MPNFSLTDLMGAVVEGETPSSWAWFAAGARSSHIETIHSEIRAIHALVDAGDTAAAEKRAGQVVDLIEKDRAETPPTLNDRIRSAGIRGTETLSVETAGLAPAAQELTAAARSANDWFRNTARRNRI